MNKIRKRKLSSNEGVNNVYTVETIYKKKIRNNKEPLYFIKWKDWDDKYNTWEPLSNILDHSLIETFEDEIRQKQKLRKDTCKNKRSDCDKVDYESDVKIDSPDDVDTMTDVETSKKMENDKCELPAEIVVSRPKICLKIPKYRLHPPHSSTITNSLSVEHDFPEIEKVRHESGPPVDDNVYMKRLSPIAISQDLDFNKSIKDDSPRQVTKSPKKLDCLKIPQKHHFKLDSQIQKPRKLLSINEYSAAIKMKKKHHKKSKHSKHRSENRVFKSQMDVQKPIACSDKIVTPKPEMQTSPDTKSLLPVETVTHENWPKSRLNEPVLKNIEMKLDNSKFKFHSQTIVTDVTVNGLCVTVKEMSYDDFINDSYPRFQMVRIPRNSDWMERYHGKKDEKHECESLTTDNEDELMIIANDLDNQQHSKKTLLDRFEERIIPGLRPPSRPRSVDSYRTIMDKSMYEININHFSESLTPNKLVTDTVSICENIISKTINGTKSPLNVVIDECEEVDVVGGIESENSYMSSLQSSRTVTTQLRQARIANQSPVSSMFQSLWHSYSYEMPPLQAAPWVHSHESGPSQSYQLTPRVTNSPHYLSRSSSIDPTLLKYTQGVPLSFYQQSSSLLSNLYLGTSEETPIDLSFK